MCNGFNMAWLIACGHAQAKRENNITIIMDLCARALKWYRILPVRLMPYNYLMAIVRMCQCKGTVNEYYRKHLLHSYLKRLEIMFELVCAMYDCTSTHLPLPSPSPSLTPCRHLAGLYLTTSRTHWLATFNCMLPFLTRSMFDYRIK